MLHKWLVVFQKSEMPRIALVNGSFGRSILLSFNHHYLYFVRWVNVQLPYGTTLVSHNEIEFEKLSARWWEILF